jgi:hypothetical protein
VDPYESVLHPSPRRLKWSAVFCGFLLAGAIVWGSAYTVVSMTIFFVLGLWAVRQTRR